MLDLYVSANVDALRKDETLTENVEEIADF